MMNSLDWEDTVRRLQGHRDPNHNPVVNNSMETVSRTNDDLDAYGKYSRYTVDEPQSNMGMSLGSRRLAPPLHNFYTEELEAEVPDGEPFELNEDDAELSRKRKELEEIEDRIIHKKLAIALKKVEPLVKETSPSDFPYDEQLVTCEGSTLKDRVNAILRQRHSVSFLSKVQVPKARMNSSSEDVLPQEDHPLKLRVKALMKRRCRDHCVSPTNAEIPDVTRSPPSRSVASPAREENGINKGFERFLSVLNKGVDIDLLSRIVKDDSEDLPLGEELVNTKPPAVENKSDLPFRGESQRLKSAASLLGRSWTNSGERETDPLSQVRCLDESLSRPNGDKESDRAGLCLVYSRPPKSPTAAKKSKKEENIPNVDEQNLQLQNVLKSLGLSLEVEEMSKLADRTQERLYGKKHESMKAISREEQESQQRVSQRQHRDSPSSFSSSSLRSTSRSISPSPSRRRCSHSQDSKQRRKAEGSGSRDRGRDRLKCQNRHMDHEETQTRRDRDKERRDSNETSTYQHPYAQNQETHPHFHPDAFSAVPKNSLSHDPLCSAYHSDIYSAAAYSYWTFSHPPFSYTSGHPNSQNPPYDFPGSVWEDNPLYPRTIPPEELFYHVNPDLSQSEGQTGSASAHRCLQVISTKQSHSCLKQLPDSTEDAVWKKTKKNKQQSNQDVLTQTLESSNQKVKQNRT